jgi:hypothetical protein
VCWKPCSSCWSLHLLQEEFLSTPIHYPLSGSPYRSFTPTEDTFARGRPPSQAVQLPRLPAPRDVLAGRAPLGPAVRPRPPALVHSTTTGASPRCHRRSSTRPIKGIVASPRVSTEPLAAIAVLASSSTLHKCLEPSNHLFPFHRPC